ncbi:arsenic resistance N-acetyltransferase ArsN2 [Paraburkholderia sp. RL17-347-BIC-D]|uniref:arsenic resistance N-acetyltransferase ArsN2 n=1 Tax=Paraburkholderia sp. RL17-347-BIC-D TaxID=3031632 RepID=UPI0038B6E18A
MRIRAAQSNDFVVIKDLLVANGLPSTDVSAALLNDFWVIENTAGILVGSIGLERYGQNSLLRSLAVAQPARNAGIGAMLVAHVERMAFANGITQLWLLTTTAAEFFQRKGYEIVDRSLAPLELQTSSQFANLCPATAVCMVKSL